MRLFVYLFLFSLSLLIIFLYLWKTKLYFQLPNYIYNYFPFSDSLNIFVSRKTVYEFSGLLSWIAILIPSVAYFFEILATSKSRSRSPGEALGYGNSLARVDPNPRRKNAFQNVLRHKWETAVPPRRHIRRRARLLSRDVRSERSWRPRSFFHCGDAPRESREDAGSYISHIEETEEIRGEGNSTYFV